MKFQIYIDYDDNPEYGGQQGVYFLEDTYSFKDLIGSKIIDIGFRENDPQTMILTLEK